MPDRFRPCLAIVAGLALTGCMGSITAPTPTPGDPEATLATYAANQRDLTLRLALDPVPPPTLPTGGSARLDGTLTLIPVVSDPNDSLRGAMRLEVDFARAEMTGAARDFVLLDNDAVRGTSTLREAAGALGFSGPVAGGDDGITGDVTGTLELASTGLTPVTGTMSGGFHGAPGALVAQGGMEIEATGAGSLAGTWLVGE